MIPNPFPETAVLRLSGFRRLESMTVSTPAFGNALAQIQEYLQSDSGGPDPYRPGTGKCLAITGVYGSGKTHLAATIARYVGDADLADVRLFQLETPMGGFLAAYLDQLIEGFDENEVYDLLDDYYSRVTADALEARLPGNPLVDGLRSRMSIDPQKVVDTYHLGEQAIRRDLGELLGTVTDNKRFSVPLSLMQQRDLQRLVWEWFQGNGPDQALAERGVTSAINTSAAAFDAFGVLTFLFARAGRRFVLLIDEFEKLLEAASGWDISALQGFERLINTFIDAGGLVVFCGLPESVRALPGSIRERITIVRLSAMTSDDTIRLIQGYQDGRISPFSEQIAEYITELCDGIPRHILRLCRRSVSLANGSGHSMITRELVRQAVRGEYERATLADVTATIGEMLRSGGWHFTTGYSRAEARIDFLLPARDTGPGIAILVSGSLLQESEAEQLKQRVEIVRAMPIHPQVVVVVNGYLSTPAREIVSLAIGRQPLVFDELQFTGDFRTLIHDLFQNIGGPARSPSPPGWAAPATQITMDAITSSLDRISRQHSYTQGAVEQLIGSVDTGQAELRRRLAALQAELEAFEARPGALAAGAHPRAERPLPDALRRHFDTALRAVKAVSDVELLFGQAFGRSGTSPRTVSAAALSRRISAPEVFRSLGVAVLLQQLLEAFQESVAEWFERVHATPPDRKRDGAERERLQEICNVYEVVADVLPLFRLQNLADIMPLRSEGDATERATRSARRSEMYDAFDNLSGRVFEEAIKALAS